MIIKCTKEECKYEWDYQGDSTFYATCPRCLTKVKVNQTEKKEKKK